MSDRKDSLIGDVIADRYQVLQLLGEGGMGRVYLAEHVRMGRKSAVKVMSPNLALSAEAISRFNREAANASRINHPHVAQIYDFGETHDGLLYLAMEFVEGETLRSMIEREGALPAMRAAHITRQTADALAAAHHLGIVHRDLKPDNVMITRHHDGTDWVKVVDFGIAKTVQGSGDTGGSQTVTTAGVSLGTPEYMSPEQLAGERLDNRTDLYSLGLVLFNMLTANLPYPRVTSRETLVRRLTEPARSLHDVAPNGDWPPALQAALDKALAPEPNDRYVSVSDFGSDVVAAASAMADPDRTVRMTPVIAPRIVARTRPLASAQPPRVRRGVYTAAGILLVVAAVGAGGVAAMRARSKAPPARVAVTPPSIVPAPSVAPAGASPGKQTDSTVHSDSAVAVHPPVVTPSGPLVAKPAPVKKSAAFITPAPSEHGARQTAPAERQLASAPPVAADTMAAARNRTMGQFQHPWLRANGDSARTQVPASDNDAQRIAIIAGDLEGHMTRAEAFMRSGDIPRARAEYRDAVPVLRILRELYVGAPAELEAEKMIRRHSDQTIQGCFQTMSDSAIRSRMAPMFRCEGLVPPMMTGRGQRGVRLPAMP